MKKIFILLNVSQLQLKMAKFQDDADHYIYCIWFKDFAFLNQPKDKIHFGNAV
jgi:hypothetical protein